MKKSTQQLYLLMWPWYYLPLSCLTLHSVSIGLIKGEPRMVCILIIWSSRMTWMSSTADTILVACEKM